MDYDEIMRRMKAYKTTRYPVVSMYVNSHWTEEFHKKRTTLFFKNEWNEVLKKYHDDDAPNDVIDSLKNDRAKIEEYLRDTMRGMVDSEYSGLVIFASHAADFFEVFGSHSPFEDQLIVDSVPHLKQLAEMADEYEGMLLIMIDSSRARVYDIELSGLEQYIASKEEVPSHHKAGGWSQLRFQRHVETHRDWHHKEIASQVEHIVDDENIKNIVIAGQNNVIAQFVKFLPKRVLERVFMKVHLDLIEPEHEVLQTVLEHLQDHEREKESQGVAQAIQEASIGGRGTVGLHSTLKAVNERLVHRLYISNRFDAHGHRCGNCRLLSTIDRNECPYCSSSELKEVDLDEEMVNDVVEAGGEVDVVKGDENLEEHEGIAAITRYQRAAL